MKRTYSVTEEKLCWTPDLGNGEYQNPIIHADYSDPDVIRVEEDFFMVASSFNMSPCLPVLHSKDLVNWTIVNHVFDEFPYSRYNLPQHGDGVWAPSLRYHNEKYWVFFGAPDEGIFMCNTDNPFGKWSSPHLVKEVKGWIDPCPFWDEDGQAYLVNAFAKSRICFKSVLQLSKMKEDGTALLEEGRKLVFDGNLHHPTIEGPKIYKRAGYYYIFAPAGGVATGWQTVLRSRSIYGPYEDKIVLAQGETDINGPHQGAWIELESGESWFIHFQDKGAYGRITHLQPMSWKNDWPIIGESVDGKVFGEPVRNWKKPLVCNQQNPMTVPQSSDEFTCGILGPQWQWKANWKKEWFSLKEKDSSLRLYAVQQHDNVDSFYETPNILTQKFPAEEFIATIKMSFGAASEKDVTGLLVCGEEYAGILLKGADLGLEVLQLTGRHYDGETKEKISKEAIIDGTELFVRLEVKKDAVCQFSYSYNNEQYHLLDQAFIAKPGRWVGAQVGIFCLTKDRESRSGYVDIDWIRFQPLPQNGEGGK